ncbi:MAG: hypothetical protein ACI9TV_000475 [Sulfurimonas sp.]|jgi:hypothetical protein|uniref:hypothetical protein n=1 Tax=Sulfurimonas sp. TaxID=2022749 RepID=UPI0039E4C955
MNKISILALISTLVLSTSSVFAQTDAEQTNTADLIVEDIIAEIKKAKTTPIEETFLIKKELEVKVAKTVIPVVDKVETKVQPIVVKKVATKVQAKRVPIKAKTEVVVAISQAKKITKVHTITLPTVPKPPEAIQLSVKLVDENGNIICENLEDIYPKREKIIFSTNVAPERFSKKRNSEVKEILPGDIDNARVTAYIQSPLLSVGDVVNKLKNAGFDILSIFKVDKKGTVTSIVFTNEAMKKAASKNIRGFAGTLRVVVDAKNKLVNISNPIYIMKAFMQKEYNPNVAEKMLSDIRSQFSDLKNSKEVVKFAALERYQFMENMPFYQDMKVIGKAKNEELLKRVKKSKKIIYTQHLSNGSIVVGVKLGKRTSKFVKKIGYQNSGILPYPVLIENGEAKIMAPQYYIAIMYPQLKMSKFMTIATVPGAITKDIDKIFR